MADKVVYCLTHQNWDNQNNEIYFSISLQIWTQCLLMQMWLKMSKTFIPVLLLTCLSGHIIKYPSQNFVRARWHKFMKKTKSWENQNLEGGFCTESIYLKNDPCYAHSVLPDTNPLSPSTSFSFSFPDSIMCSATTGIWANLCVWVCVSQHLHNAMFTLWGHLLQLILPPFMKTKKSSVNQKSPNTHGPVCLHPPSAAQKKHKELLIVPKNHRTCNLLY